MYKSENSKSFKMGLLVPRNPDYHVRFPKLPSKYLEADIINMGVYTRIQSIRKSYR